MKKTDLISTQVTLTALPCAFGDMARVFPLVLCQGCEEYMSLPIYLTFTYPPGYEHLTSNTVAFYQSVVDHIDVYSLNSL